VVSNRHCVVTHRIHEGKIGQTLVGVEEEGALEGVAAAKEQNIGLGLPEAYPPKVFPRMVVGSMWA
jgi:hypothetical protein